MTEKKQRKKQPTALDVARLSGTSKSAVSRAFSSEKRSISKALREKVFAAAKQLGYQPNHLASSLTTRRTNLIAILVNHIHDFSDLDLFDALIAQLQKQGKQSIIIRLNDMDKIKKFMSLALSYHVDGVLVFSDILSSEQVNDIFETSNIIMLNGLFGKDVKNISLDEQQGISQAVRYLKQKDARVVGLITGRETSLSEQKRIKTYKENILRSKMKVCFHACGDYSYADGYNLSKKYLKNHSLDAILCSSDAMAMGAIDYIRDRQEYSHILGKIIGFDDISLAQMLKPYRFPTIGFERDVYINTIVKMITKKQEVSKEKGQKINIPTFLRL